LAESEASSSLAQQGLLTVNNDLKEEIESLEKQIEQLKQQTQIEVSPKG